MNSVDDSDKLSLANWIVASGKQRGREVKYFDLQTDKAPCFILDNGNGDTINLPSTGILPAIPASQLQVGDVLVWSHCGLEIVRTITRSASDKTLTIQGQYIDYHGDRQSSSRKLKANRLVAALRYSPTGYQSRRTPDGDPTLLTQAEYVAAFACRMHGENSEARKLTAKHKHRFFVMDAVRAGKTLPVDVLKDYPGLR